MESKLEDQWAGMMVHIDYKKENPTPYDKLPTQTLWEYSMNDSRWTDLCSYDELFSVEYERLNAVVSKSDIIVSHINPSRRISHQTPRFANSITTKFYCFNGIELVKRTSAQYWVYGHTHEENEYSLYNTKFLCNPLDTHTKPKVEN